MVDKEDIKKIVYTTIAEYEDFKGKCSIIKSSPYYQNAIRLSEKYGLKLKRCTRTELRFEDLNHVNPLNDRITSTEIRFDNVLGNPQINFYNDIATPSKGNYSLDDVLGYYTSMPQALKNGTGLMVFDNISSANYSIIYDSNLRRENVVHITNNAFSESNTNSLERVMAHEMGHCLEYGQLTPKEKNLVKRINERDYDNISTEDITYFEDYISPKLNTYSNPEGVFGKAVSKDFDDLYNSEDYTGYPSWVIDCIPSTYAKNFALRSDGDDIYSEHFAETVSVMSFRDKDDKSGAMVNTGDNGEHECSYFEYVLEGGQANSIPVVEDLLFGDSKGYDIGYVHY